MFSSMIKNKHELNTLLKDDTVSINEDEWKMITFLSDLLLVVKKGLAYLEGEKYPTLNCVLPVEIKIAEKWKVLQDKYSDCSEIVIYADSKLFTRFPVKFLQENSPYILLACFCDPRYSDFKFMNGYWKDAEKEEAMSFCRTAQSIISPICVVVHLNL